MSRSTNPKIIGAFVTASIALLVMLVLFFGSTKLFSQSIRYILFFEHSVNGLNIGSPVKYKGVPVGVVEHILIRVEGQNKDSTAIPVIVRIDRSRLTNRLGTSVEVFDPEFINEMIKNGLVAQLNVESFITGQLFVEFSLLAQPVKNLSKNRDREYGMVEIPTIGSPFYKITDDVGSVISSFAEIDFLETSQSLNAVLENLARVLQGLDTGELKAILSSMRSLLTQIEKTFSTYDLEEGPLAETTVLLNQTLAGLNVLIAEGNDLISPESDMRYELQSSLRELGQAARSLRVFMNYLERNPNALLTGRPEDSP